MPQNCYELVWIFMVYAFMGWCMEVSYAALDTGKFVNRGFLNGPYCPVYGCGVVIVIAVLTPLKDNLLILFSGSVILTSLLEFITGFVLEKIFHNRWWDYSDKPFNINGYVCLKFSIYWGLACTFVMDVIHPVIYKGITSLPHLLGNALLLLFMGSFAVDFGVTVSTVLKFNRHLKVLEETAAALQRLSDEIGVNIYENVTGIIEKTDELQEEHMELLEKISEKTADIMELPELVREKLADKAENARLAIDENIREAKSGFAAKTAGIAGKKKNQERKRSEWEKLMAEYNSLLGQKSAGFKRLLKAFPDMRSLDRNEILQKYKKHFNHGQHFPKK